MGVGIKETVLILDDAVDLALSCLHVKALSDVKPLELQGLTVHTVSVTFERTLPHLKVPLSLLLWPDVRKTADHRVRVPSQSFRTISILD